MYKSSLVQASTLALCLLLLLAMTAPLPAGAQPTPTQFSSTPAPQAPTAFVYVSVPGLGSPSGNNIVAYAVAPSGTLSEVPGSPFQSTASLGQIIAGPNFVYVEAYANGTASLDSYSVAANGALSSASSTPVEPSSLSPVAGCCWGPYTDRHGRNVVDHGDIYGLQSNGSLGFISFVNSNNNLNEDTLSFTANDHYAYGADFFNGTPNFYGFIRNSDGSLTYFNPDANLPAPAAGQSAFVPYGGAASGDFVVFGMQNGAQPLQPVSQLAVYSINPTSGMLHTNDTAATMPVSQVGYANAYAFDPTGRWFAVGGDNGVQIFSFVNGKLTPAGSALGNSNPVTQLAWDNAGHLITSSYYSSQVSVYNVRNGVPTLAPGSPQTVPAPAFDTIYMTVKPVQPSSGQD